MAIAFLWALLLFVIVVLGPGWPVASRLGLAPLERICAAVVLSLVIVHLLAFASYVAGLPPAALRLIPLLAAAGLLAGGRRLVAIFREMPVRTLLLGQALVTAACLGWLLLVASYSGGGWAGDWFEHWQRTLFFLRHDPLDTRFLGQYALPARPPLANVVTGVLLAATTTDFAHYQFFMTLLNSLAFLPAALLAHRFGGRRTAIAVLAALVMVNPSFVENATFAWTKLLCVFFVLSGLYFFLVAAARRGPGSADVLCGVALAAGILTHYSAAPYAVLLAAGWWFVGRRRPSVPGARRRAALAGGAAVLLLATWFGWSFATYGWRVTLLSNTSVTAVAPSRLGQLEDIALNLRDTLVPHFLRTVDPALIAQRSPWGAWRDWFFQAYQLNLFLMLGSVGWLVLLAALAEPWRRALPPTRGFWGALAGGSVLLGVAVFGGRDHWGVAHLCLQSLVLLGLAVIAARWHALGRFWRGLLVAGAAADFLFGIALHFAVQSYVLDAWITPRRPPAEWLASYSQTDLMNLAAKVQLRLVFFGDLFAASPALLLALPLCLLMLALARVHASRDS